MLSALSWGQRYHHVVGEADFTAAPVTRASRRAAFAAVRRPADFERVMAELGDSLRPEYTATFELLRRLTGEAPASWDGLVDWTALPRSLDPLAGGGVPPSRATRKRLS